MPILVSWEEGAKGTVKAVSKDGSFFEFKSIYLPFKPEALPCHVESELLEAAVEAGKAEARAIALLARAEQYSMGLRKKLLTKGYSKELVSLVLENLETKAVLSDQRYAASWIRQRLRRHLEGPRKLASELAAKGLDRHAVMAAMQEEVLSMDKTAERLEIIKRQIMALLAKGKTAELARDLLYGFGWSRQEIDECCDSLELS
ncbi:hypothetical protein MASR2M29_16500 [Spirochaetota bacterium]